MGNFERIVTTQRRERGSLSRSRRPQNRIRYQPSYLTSRQVQRCCSRFGVARSIRSRVRNRVDKWRTVIGTFRTKQERPHVSAEGNGPGADSLNVADGAAASVGRIIAGDRNKLDLGIGIADVTDTDRGVDQDQFIVSHSARA